MNVLTSYLWHNDNVVGILIYIVGYDFGALTGPGGELLSVYKSLFSPSRTSQLWAVVGAFLPYWLVRALP
jgi:hypothetical protein